MPRDKTGHFYYAWFPTIYQQDTQNLTLQECGAYRRLIDHYMLTRAPLPCSDRALSRIVGCGLEEWLPISETLKSYFKAKEGNLHHSFCDEQLGRDQKRILRSQVNGSKPKSIESIDNNPLGTQPVLPNQNNHNKTDKTDKPNHLNGRGQGEGFLHASGLVNGLRFVPTLETCQRLMDITPGWDQNMLIDKYNSWHKGHETPRNPDAAFLGWAKRFTKGQRPQ